VLSLLLQIHHFVKQDLLHNWHITAVPAVMKHGRDTALPIGVNLS